MLFFAAVPAWAQSSIVLAVGDGLVAGSSGPSGAWVPALADCLEERAPHGYTVVDRVSADQTLASARAHAAEAKGLGASVVVLALGSREVAGEWQAGPVRTALGALVADARGARRILLVPPVPGTAAAPGLAAYDALLVDLAKADPAVERVDLLSTWPRDGAMTQAGALSEQGSARVAAAVCAAVLAP